MCRSCAPSYGGIAMDPDRSLTASVTCPFEGAPAASSDVLSPGVEIVPLSSAADSLNTIVTPCTSSA